MTDVRKLERWDEPLSELEAADRNPDVLEEYTGLSESDPEKSYLLRKVRVLTEAAEEADAAVDNAVIILCSCGDYRHRKWKNTDLDDLEHAPRCKHGSSTDRAERHAQDQNQQTLSNPVGK